MVWPASVGFLDVPSPLWNGKGPNSCKDEPIPVSTSLFSRLSHSMSSTTSSLSPSSSSSSLSVSSPRPRAYSFSFFFFLLLSSFAFLSRSPSARLAALTDKSLGNGAR